MAWAPRSSGRPPNAQELYHRGQAYGIPGQQVDGMDVIAVYEAGKEVITKVKAGEGPHIIEMQTYRYRGHSMSDPAKYRTREEVQKYRSERDPIENLKSRILEAKMMNEEEFKQLDREIKEIVADAADFAQSSPEPDPAELWTEVLVDDAPPECRKEGKSHADPSPDAGPLAHHDRGQPCPLAGKGRRGGAGRRRHLRDRDR